MKFNIVFVSFNILLFINYSLCQDCISYGKRCSDHGQCCGGCCFEGVCIDTYRSCFDLRNPCIDHYCPPSMECRVFKPDNCLECELQAICE